MVPTKIFTLGGLQEIGKATIVIEHGDEIIIIDCGIKFADSWLTGVDGIIPDYQYLRDNQPKIKALFITHAHEDHIGGIPYLLKEVKIPVVYAPALGVAYITNRLREHKLQNATTFETITPELVVTFAKISVDFWTAQHSIPDAFGVRVKTPQGTVADTGDFRFDYTPIGNLTDFSKMQKIGVEGLDLLISDSTNAMKPQHSPSEQGILLDIARFMKEAKGKVIFTTFASNQTRVKAVIELAEKMGKKVVTFGRSMVRGVEIGIKLGNIKVNPSVLVDKKDLKRYKDNEIVVLTTGSQGEERAALVAMSQSKHAHIKLKRGDLVIFSCSPIPGNRMQIELLVNRLSKLQVTIKQHGVDGYLHTSGHAYHDEHVKAFELLRPRFFLPYHGEYRMSVAHGKTAVETGVPPENVIFAKNGQVIEMVNHQVKLTRNVVDPGPVFIDGKVASKTTSHVINQRVKLSHFGFVNVVALVDRQKKQIIGRTRLISRGAFYVNDVKQEMVEAQKAAHGAILYTINNKLGWTVQELGKTLEKRLTNFFYKRKHQRPVIVPSIIAR